jgi:photosystem II stability/assembly factor-like uncharacterized protein
MTKSSFSSSRSSRLLPVFALVLLLLIGSTVTSAASADNSSAKANTSLVDGNNSMDQPSAADSLPDGKWNRIADLPRSINDLLADVNDPGVFYAGTGEQGSGSGVYKSEDYGLTWQRASEGLPNADVESLIINPNSPHRLYAALFDSARAHLYSSDDGAKSWNMLSNTGIFGGLKQRLIIDPNNGENQFLIIPPNGLFRSRDGGRNWQPINEGLPKDQAFDQAAYVLTVAVDPNDSKIVYAGTGSISGQGNGVFKSTDGGMTWSPANRGMIDYRISASTIDPTDSMIIYAGAEKGELFKSTNAGVSWNDTSDRHIMDLFSTPTVVDIFVDPANPKTVYVLTEEAGILVSHDAGSSWLKLGRPEMLEDSLRFTAMAVAFNPHPVLIIGVDPYIKNGGAWRFAAASSI